MREIKFRAWNRVTKKFMDIINITFDFCDSNITHIDTIGASIVCTIPYKVPQEAIVTQFTGLKDKNGKEIYEGDIIEHIGYPTYNLTPEIIVIANLNFFMQDIGYDSREMGADWTSESMKIIGNRFENSKQLKGDQE